MARVSDDHAGESTHVAHLAVPGGGARPRAISPSEVEAHNGREGSRFWAVVDGFVCDASTFVDSHPGGLKKLLSTDSGAVGATGKRFGFSFSRGKNAHFPGTGVSFSDGVKRFLRGEAGDDTFLPPAEVEFGGVAGKLVILGKLDPAG